MNGIILVNDFSSCIRLTPSYFFVKRCSWGVMKFRRNIDHNHGEKGGSAVGRAMENRTVAPKKAYVSPVYETETIFDVSANEGIVIFGRCWGLASPLDGSYSHASGCCKD